MAYLLHIDTATDCGRYFVAHDGILISQTDSGANRDHAATLPGLVAGVLQAAGIGFSEIDAVAVNGGPGSYTGLRIGVGAAKGYCFALQKPLLLASRLLLLCQTVQEQTGKAAFALLPARTGEYFAAALSPDGATLLPPGHFFTQDLINWLSAQKLQFSCIGTPQQDLAGSLPQAKWKEPVYVASVWAYMAFEDFKYHNFADLAHAEPYYLKAAFTTQPRKAHG